MTKQLNYDKHIDYRLIKGAAAVIAIIAALAFFLLYSYENAYAEFTTKATARINASSGCDLKESDTRCSDTVATLADNTKITIYKEIFKKKNSDDPKYKWYYVYAKGKKGYVRSDRVDGIEYTAASGKITNDTVYYSVPGTAGDAAGSLKKGKAITVYLKARPVKSVKGSSLLWYKIKKNKNFYYVSSADIEIVGSIFENNTDDKEDNTTDFSSMSDAEFEAFIKKQGFPKSYRTKLIKLHKKHPNWGFYAYKTDLNWKDAVSRIARSAMIESNASMKESSYKASAEKLYEQSSVQLSDQVSDQLPVQSSNPAPDQLSDQSINLVSDQLSDQLIRADIDGTQYRTDADVIDEYSVISDILVTCTDASGQEPDQGQQPEDQLVIIDDLLGQPEGQNAASDGQNAEQYGQDNTADQPQIIDNTIPESTAAEEAGTEYGDYASSEAAMASWVRASSKTVAFFMDPRNFINEKSIFMFELLSYKSEYQTKKVVAKVISPTKLPKYGFSAKLFVDAGKKYNISPVHLASRARQETGGGSIAIDGSQGVYNPFNIGASSTVTQGITYARKRKWTTQKKSVYGAAEFLTKGYINNKQDTIYYERFDVKKGISSVGTHVYMTNIRAPYFEAVSSRNAYKSYGILKENIVFEIPVYKNMPKTTSL